MRYIHIMSDSVYLTIYQYRFINSFPKHSQGEDSSYRRSNIGIDRCHVVKKLTTWWILYNRYP